LIKAAYTLRLWQEFSNNFKRLRVKTAGNQRGDTGQVSARTGEARRKSYPDRIGDEEYYNWYVRGRVLNGTRGLRRNGDDEIGLRSQEVGGERRKLVEARTRFLTFDDNVGSLDPPQLAKLLEESVHVAPGARGGAQHSNAWHLRRGLESGCRRKDKQPNQKNRHRSGKSFHSITLSARARIVGTARPSGTGRFRGISGPYLGALCLAGIW
jgi:hypothetical protein